MTVFAKNHLLYLFRLAQFRFIRSVFKEQKWSKGILASELSVMSNVDALFLRLKRK